MTRIVGGRFSGRRLATPSGATTRPTSEKIRAAVANSLESAGALAGASVLDLYAGSGALGLEMLSRGARRLVLVEQHRAAITAIRTNIAALDSVDAEVRTGSVINFCAQPGEAFDIVLADPPYDLPAEALGEALTALYQAGGMTAGADIVLERAARAGDFIWPEPLVARRAKRYGDTMIFYGQAP